MLQILLLILKILGIILAVILGILITVLLLVLFVPVCYRGAAKWDLDERELKAQGSVRWLFGLLELRFAHRDGRTHLRGRIAWKKLDGRAEPERAGGMERKVPAEKEAPAEKEVPAEKEEEHEKEREKGEETVEKPAKEEKAAEDVPEASEEDAQTAEENTAHDEKESAGSSEKYRKIRQAFQKIRERIPSLLKKIKCTFRAICDKINLLMEKREEILAFLGDEAHRSAYRIVKKEGIRLLRRTAPRHLRLSVCFGFADPYHTGQALAGLAVLYPFVPGEIRVIPDFERRVCRGRAQADGRLYAVHFVFAAFQVLRRRAVRQTYRDIRDLFQAEA